MLAPVAALFLGASIAPVIRQVNRFLVNARRVFHPLERRVIGGQGRGFPRIYRLLWPLRRAAGVLRGTPLPDLPVLL